VAIAYDDYVEGHLPHVCLISGLQTEDVFVLRAEVPAAPDKPPGAGLVGGLERLVTVIDVRKPKHILLGRVPVDRAVWQGVQLHRRAWTVTLVGTLVALVIAAWVAASWSPVVAVASAALALVAAWRRREWVRKVPKPHLSHGGTRVTLDRVHPGFAEAIARERH